ncbi:hypothetical protein B0H19DRAFT_1131783 [Mycena capillaripes]|nr:hypothetical protein B0H19DRAFT_1131783 [Mycena capillaripes]
MTLIKGPGEHDSYWIGESVLCPSSHTYSSGGKPIRPVTPVKKHSGWLFLGYATIQPQIWKIQHLISSTIFPKPFPASSVLFSSMFEILSTNPPAIVSPTFSTIMIIGMPSDVYALKEFHDAFQSLKTLHISVISNVQSDGAYFQDRLVRFWHTCARQKCSIIPLRLPPWGRRHQEVGSEPVMSFDGIPLPHLGRLSPFTAPCSPPTRKTDVLEYILRHRGTLARFALDKCSIFVHADGACACPWNAVLLVKDELPALQDFALTTSIPPHVFGFPRDLRLRYLIVFEYHSKTIAVFSDPIIFVPHFVAWSPLGLIEPFMSFLRSLQMDFQQT